MNSACLRHFFEHSADLLATLSSDLKLRQTNAAWQTVLGWDGEQLSGRPLESLLRGADGAALQQALETHEALEVSIAHRGGSYRNFSLSLAKVDGELCCAARASPGEAYLANQILAGSIPHLVWLAARDGVPQYVDQHWRDFTGWEPQQPETKQWLTAVHPDDRAEAGNLWTRATGEGGPFQAQCRLRSKSGDYRWFLASALPLRSPHGDVHHWLGTCTDIHELRQAQDAREAQSRGLATILESITDSFFAVDRGWCFTYLNNQAERMLQVRREDVLGRSIWNVFGSGDGPFEQYFRDAMERSILTEFEEFYEPLQLWIEVRAYPTPDGLAVYFRDTTEKRRLAEQLRESTKLEITGILAGGVAHDFNNLLTGIIGNASLAQSMLRDGEPIDHMLAAIVHSGERAAALTRQLLEYSGRGHFVIGKVDVSALVAQVQPLIQTAAGKIKIRLVLGSHLPLVEADDAQLRQVLFNLIINASEAIGDTPGGVIEIHTFALEVDAAWLRDHVVHGTLNPGRHVCLQVSDSGCGIDPAILGRIFDPFFTTKFTGRGLGLAAAAGIIRSHRGAMLVESTPRQGTTFQIFFAAL